MPNQFSGCQGIRVTCCANSKTRPLVSPARRHARHQVANGADRFTFACEQPIPAMPVTTKARPHFYVRSSSAVRPLFVGNIHDRAISQAEAQLQATPVSAGRAHAVFQLASFPTPKGVGSSTSFSTKGITWRSTSLPSVAGPFAGRPARAG